MHLFNGIEWKILSLVAYKNGFSDATREFSVRYLAAKTGESKSTIHRHLKLMLTAGLLHKRGEGRRKIQILEIPALSPFQSTATAPSIVAMHLDRTVPNKEMGTSPVAVQVSTPSVPLYPVPQWSRIKTMLQATVPSPMYRQFIEKLRVTFDGKSLNLHVINPQQAQHLQKFYLQRIKEAALQENVIEVEICLDPA
ncbi:MAG: helix-turn-helix domain-containing protein [Leptospirales bacterium]|nr:helix-turn-helix domain-containing protein [Leptospirales bacterium]